MTLPRRQAGAPLLHLDLASLSLTTGPEAHRELIEAARCLPSLPGVLSTGVIEADAGADFELAFLFVLAEPAALERFGTHPEYSRFLQGSLAPRLHAFAGADVRLEGEFPALQAYAACLALTAPDETFDWEVTAALKRWVDGLGAPSHAIGLAVGEKQRYRGAALAFADRPLAAQRPQEARFGATLVYGRAQSLP